MEVRYPPAKELKDVVRLVKALLAGDRDFGMDPPPISSSTLKVLEGGASGPEDRSAGFEPVHDLDGLRDMLAGCRRCPLHAGRNRPVLGEGRTGAELMFVGEGPGEEEDRAGRPFVGEAGRLLTRIIQAMNLSRSDVYICNVVKCRPPGNRNPDAHEIASCLPYLCRQIELVAPRIICTLGGTAGQALLGKGFSVTRDRGAWFDYQGTPVMPTFHPAHLLRNQAAKRAVWEDVQKIMKRLNPDGGRHE
jgi:uracil-DNA glycosylase